MPLSRPIKCETKSNHDLVARVIRTLSSLFFFYFKYIQFLWFYSYDYVSLAIATLNQKALYSTLMILARFHACFRLFFSDLSRNYRHECCVSSILQIDFHDGAVSSKSRSLLGANKVLGECHESSASRLELHQGCVVNSAHEISLVASNLFVIHQSCELK